MNIYAIIAKLPIGTEVRLKDDPSVKHIIHGYEWFDTDANIIFRDGTKLSIKRLELIAEVC